MKYFADSTVKLHESKTALLSIYIYKGTRENQERRLALCNEWGHEKNSKFQSTKPGLWSPETPIVVKDFSWAFLSACTDLEQKRKEKE